MAALQRFTVVSFHAHPDDEALLVAGTLARCVAEGHRVVLVVATVGEAGLAAESTALGERRRSELQRSAEAIGCARVEVLGYADSGYAGSTQPGSPPPSAAGELRVEGISVEPFSRADVEEAAERLAAILREEHADVVTIYDPAGGYGHADHVQVTRVGRRAAELAETPVVLAATVDRTVMARLLRLGRSLRWLLRGLDIPEPDGVFSAREHITHRVDVSRFVDVKRAAMTAHVSQATSDSGVRTLAIFLRLPRWLFRRAFAHEWFVELGRAPQRPPLDDIFATLRPNT